MTTNGTCWHKKIADSLTLTDSFWKTEWKVLKFNYDTLGNSFLRDASSTVTSAKRYSLQGKSGICISRFRIRWLGGVWGAVDAESHDGSLAKVTVWQRAPRRSNFCPTSCTSDSIGGRIGISKAELLRLPCTQSHNQGKIEAHANEHVVGKIRTTDVSINSMTPCMRPPCSSPANLAHAPSTVANVRELGRRAAHVRSSTVSNALIPDGEGSVRSAASPRLVDLFCRGWSQSAHHHSTSSQALVWRTTIDRPRI
jgi:hypothetical protein